MSIERVKRLLKQKENMRLEFKEASIALPGNLFETICAMLNREGGDIILGVNDLGKVTGVEENHLNTMIKNLVNLTNNAQKLDPPFILFPTTHIIDNKYIVHIQVPASSQLHKTADIVFDRSSDGDFKVKHPHQIVEIYNRKRAHYTEGVIFPKLLFKDFKADLFPRIRNLIRSNHPNHPWLSLSNKQMLEKAGLWKHDMHTGKDGYTLAAVLMLGKDEVIQSVLPHYKIDALLRVKDTERYDDRMYIQTNLIEAYEQLMDFVSKHLPDKFYMEGDQRISIRTKLFREVVANLIVHREYMSAHTCTFIIYADRVETQNANNPHGEGPLDLNKFAPFSKNPVISKFFAQLGRVEELGSGFINVNRLMNNYSDIGKPQFIEGDTFKIIIPVDAIPKNTNKSKLKSQVAETTNITLRKAIQDVVKDSVEDSASVLITNRLIKMVLLVYNKPGIKKIELNKALNLSDTTIKRDLQTVSILVEFKGSQRTGGYFISTILNEKLSKIKQ
ncbi:MAG: RNA-binding domain-containing protein [Bacteroidia bacterium]